MPVARSSTLDTTPAAIATDLYPHWKRLGINFTGPSNPHPVDVEKLIIATATSASTDERLTVCAAAWLARFHDLIDGRRLSELTRESSARTRAYLGALLSLAIEAPDGAGRAPQFDAALSHCRHMQQAQPFYDTAYGLPVQQKWMQEHTLPLFRRWRLWHDDANLQHKSVHSLDRVLKVPELRARAFLGPSIEANCVAYTLNSVTNARSLSRMIGVTYAATHAAVERLVGRGLLVRTRNGVRQDLHLSDLCAAVLRTT
jgi:DNA-binding MarR family transcriptional regulator